MSRASTDQVLLRVESATEDSPIAVFRSKGAFNAVFASTVRSVQEISKGQGLIGVFHKDMDQTAIKQMLEVELHG